MPNYNLVVQVGHVTKDVELRYTQVGKEFANFSIAVNQFYGSGDAKKKDTSFFNCVAWGKTATLMAQMVKKGQAILIQGKLKQRTWEQNGQKRNTVEIVVDSFQMLGGGAGHGGKPVAQTTDDMPDRAAEEPQTQDGAEQQDVTDSDIPF